ncbi:NAD(+)/NADH kinase [Clostridiales bacterium COT073_COT-073]|nr:NAD(+)/NADH kinase [Clostridiales bacterium COT073_COT-073]
MSFQKILIVTNVKKDTQERFTNILKQWLEEREKKVVCVHRLNSENIKGQDLLITLGGDGTIIEVAKEVSKNETPVFGINLGHLGFLAETEENRAFAALDEVLNGKYVVEKRMMLNAYSIIGEEKNYLGSVLNEVVLKRHDISRMLAYTLEINGNLAGYYRADGAIVSTPTGSTAYNLSAGGPIILPHCENIAVTPICPHSLSARPLVLSAKDVIELEFDELNGLDDVSVTLDGKDMIPLVKGTKLQIVRSQRTTNLIRRKDTNFFSVLKEKL